MDIVKNVIQFHDHSQQIFRDIMWLNVTFYAQSNVFLATRQLEFALLRLIQQRDELFEVQCMIQGKLPVKLINPTTLHNILRNVSLHLTEGYELILGTQMKNIHTII